jgi:tRNA-dihydrouridine synthase
MQNEAPPLLADVDAFMAQTGMSPVTFGRQALNDPHFVRDLRGEGRPKPRRLWPETEQRVRAFIETRRAAITAQAAA